MNGTGNESGRVPPHSIEAEIVVLGAMLLDNNALLKGMEQLREEDFYFPHHKKIFRVIHDLFERNTVVDAITVKDELARRGQLEEIGGAKYIAELVSMASSPAIFDRHLDLLIEKSLYRKAIEVASRILEDAYMQKYEDADDLLDHAEQMILDIRAKRMRTGFQYVPSMINEVFNQINALIQHRGEVSGTPTGFDDLDHLTTGFHPGEYIVIASRPSMGKTSFALSIMRHLSVDEGIPTAIFSIEMSADQLVQRLLCMQGKIDANMLRKGELRPEDIRKLTKAAEDLRRAPIYIDDTPSISLMELRAKARRIVKEEHVKIIFIDYLQLIQGPRTENRQQEISAISRSLKSLAKEIDVPVIALSQLSRAVEMRQNKRPQLSDLRESGAIEQDADAVMFIYRDEVYNPNAKPGIAEILLSKQRNGPTGKVTLYFHKEYTLFVPYTEDEYLGEDELDIGDMPF